MANGEPATSGADLADAPAVASAVDAGPVVRLQTALGAVAEGMVGPGLEVVHQPDGATRAQASGTPPSASQPLAALPVVETLRLMPQRIVHREGHAWQTTLNLPPEAGDSPEHPVRSRWMLFENDLPLGPAHAMHAEIASLGGGRYSHWGTQLIFSTSDHSDPGRNGRLYQLVYVDPSINVVQADEGLLITRLPALVTGMPMLPGGGVELAAPVNSPNRPAVNPPGAIVIPAGVLLTNPGEYYLRYGDGEVCRVLALSDDAAPRRGDAAAEAAGGDRRATLRAITTFVAANTTGGTASEGEIWATGPNGQGGGANDMGSVDRRLLEQLFRGKRPLEVACGTTSRLLKLLLDAEGFTSRYVHWYGGRAAFDGHIALEVWLDASKRWVLVDAHFGFIAVAPQTALDVTLAIGRSPRAEFENADPVVAAPGGQAGHVPGGQPVVFDLLIDKGAWVSQLLVPALQSLAEGAIGYRPVDTRERPVFLRFAADGVTLPHALPANSLIFSGEPGVRAYRTLLYPTGGVPAAEPTEDDSIGILPAPFGLERVDGDMLIRAA